MVLICRAAPSRAGEGNRGQTCLHASEPFHSSAPTMHDSATARDEMKDFKYQRVDADRRRGRRRRAGERLGVLEVWVRASYSFTLCATFVLH